ncbi:MAG: hypothetical protein EZS28_005782 [Streblomastix strix]|uniref:Protein kinase domain-containing protein n=1 Tax=Streblomastix strix TaxID=222440 RepID=A0A5J4WUX2_9EUKA|nr:MAG: hypothetical protein EZS28_005782 [Streblomastix strix]
MDEKSAQKDLLGKQVGNYIIESIITDGGHYNIFMGKNCSVKTLADDVRTAVKIENDKTSSTTLSREAIILEAVKKYRYLITDLLGPNLRDLALRHNPSIFTLHTLLKFAYQAIEALQDIHQAGFIHCDVEAKNFFIGNSQQSAGIIYLIGFSKNESGRTCALGLRKDNTDRILRIK